MASLGGRQVGSQMESGTRHGTGGRVGCVCVCIWGWEGAGMEKMMKWRE